MVNIAILGFGTVGSGVAEVLTKNSGLIDGRVNNQVRAVPADYRGRDS